MLHVLLVRDKIRLSDVPFPLRARREIYAGALRVSQHYGRFIEDIQIIMEDALVISENANSYLFQYELHDIIAVLNTYLPLYDFGGVRSETKFRETIYRPFIEQLQTQLSKAEQRAEVF